jgi:pyruvate formate lyase activating enzyme
MRISTHEPLTLIDYPGRLAAVAFTPGCVLRCPFCHNPELVQADTCGARSGLKAFTENREDDFFAFLKRRQGKLDGVVITGGEPTLWPDLSDFIRRIKDLGFLVKLDTNGAFPDRVARLAESGLVDYWAMDIKHAPEKYALASGVAIPVEAFRESVRLIMESGAPYEFRTTVVPGIHAEEDFDAIGRWIRGARAYFLQAFRPGKTLAPERIPDAPPLPLEAIRDRLSASIIHVGIRAS